MMTMTVRAQVLSTPAFGYKKRYLAVIVDDHGRVKALDSIK